MGSKGISRVVAVLTIFFAAFAVVAQTPPGEGGPSAGNAEYSLQPRVRGLEDNDTYMRLLEEEAGLLKREDSINTVIAGIRELFRTDPDNRRAHSERIMHLEGEVFDIRSRIGAISFETGAIEQEFILNNLDAVSAPESGSGGITAGAEISANLIMNPLFRDNLPASDYRALVQAQANERLVVEYLDIYKANYMAMSRHALAYAEAKDAQQSDSIFVRYDNLREVNERVADTIASVWGSVFDNKSYAYNFLLDRMYETDLLRRMDEKGSAVRDALARMRPQMMSEAVSSYGRQKQLLLEYETTLAEMPGYVRSLDSLGKVVKEFDVEKYDLPKIDFKERFFLDFADVATASPAKYNSRNPIPAVTLYKRGVIYRVLVGDYSRLQAVTVFKGLYPLGYWNNEGRYLYFAGGYQTAEGAAEGLARVKKLGFRDAKIAEFNFGSYTVLDGARAGATDVMYRIEISGVGGKMPPAVKEQIDIYAPEKDVAKTAKGFSVGPFSSQADAATLRDALSALDQEIIAVITEIQL